MFCPGVFCLRGVLLARHFAFAVFCFSPPVAGWVEFYGVGRIGGSGDSRCEE